IVDDEPLARRGIRARLTAADIAIVGECDGGRSAIDAIHALAPDLVFLDVQMPEVDGFAVVEAIGAERMPIVIFLTAFDTHALHAFDCHALDYLLKPIDDARFTEMLGRVRECLRDRASRTTGRIAVRDRGRVALLDPRDICWVGADGDYVRIHASAHSYLVRETLNSMAERLCAPRFARIHRSTIVNVEQIGELRPMPNREFVVVLHDGTKLRSSRSYDEALRNILCDLQ
ncbi:MAG TPA: LytTR family DNA-binding domain-containing protein, partial [Gemmatimonadaceae bacterium]|nr:LytTR family DNA-binding domain-containing protein [Gemmatimonadaceae bacterium]